MAQPKPRRQSIHPCENMKKITHLHVIITLENHSRMPCCIFPMAQRQMCASQLAHVILSATQVASTNPQLSHIILCTGVAMQSIASQHTRDPTSSSHTLHLKALQPATRKGLFSAIASQYPAIDHLQPHSQHFRSQTEPRTMCSEHQPTQ